MGQAQINVRTRACSRTSIARTKQAALTHNVRGKRLIRLLLMYFYMKHFLFFVCDKLQGRKETRLFKKKLLLSRRNITLDSEAARDFPFVSLQGLNSYIVIDQYQQNLIFCYGIIILLIVFVKLSFDFSIILHIHFHPMPALYNFYIAYIL